MKTVSTPDAPAAIGPYCQAMIHGDVVYCSGQIGLLPDGQWADGDVSVQAKQALSNLGAVLTASGSRPDLVIRAEIFLKDMNDFAVVNEIYENFFAGHRPARACIEAARLPKDALVEISAIAAVDNQS
jgi:2-iminobutanoate/2-iminopropanoate deaminase